MRVSCQISAHWRADRDPRKETCGLIVPSTLSQTGRNWLLVWSYKKFLSISSFSTILLLQYSAIYKTSHFFFWSQHLMLCVFCDNVEIILLFDVHLPLISYYLSGLVFSTCRAALSSYVLDLFLHVVQDVIDNSRWISTSHEIVWKWTGTFSGGGRALLKRSWYNTQ